MKRLLIIAICLLCAGCRAPVPNVSGDWISPLGMHITLEQKDHTVTGKGLWIGDVEPYERPMTATGQFLGSTLVMDLDIPSMQPPPRFRSQLRYTVATSPKGNKQFLKCQNLAGLSLIPAAIYPEYFRYGILKKEFEEEKRPQPPADGASTGTR
jgi:hypothetical protein